MFISTVGDRDYPFNTPPSNTSSGWFDGILGGPILTLITNLFNNAFFRVVFCAAAGAAAGALAKKKTIVYHGLRSMFRTVSDFEKNHPRSLITAAAVAGVASIFFPIVRLPLVVVETFQLGYSCDSLQPLRDRLRWMRHWWG